MSSVGSELKKRRQQMKLSLTEVELSTKIRGKYLRAIESGDFSELPNDIYSRGFVQQYADFLELDGTAVADHYVEERGGLTEAATASPRLERPGKIVVTGRLATAAILFLVIVTVGAYLLWQFSSLAAPPEISVATPKDNATIAGNSVTVSGHVPAGADVMIDEVPVVSDVNGNFTGTLSLQQGVNTIHISATSKLGRTSSLNLSVLVKTKAAAQTSTATVLTANIPGIAVLVTAKRNIALSMLVDGRSTKEILVAGASKLYQGSSDVNLTTSDAGATKLTITNQVMVGKVVASLGGDGETRTNQDFTPTTKLP